MRLKLPVSILLFWATMAFAEPLSFARAVSSFEPLTPAEPLSFARAVSSSEPLTPAEPLTPSELLPLAEDKAPKALITPMAPKTHSELWLSTAYGNASPYEMKLNLNFEGPKLSFSPFASIGGIVPYNSARSVDEDYTYTGTAPLSYTSGSRYVSHKESYARGLNAAYGFALGYMPGKRHELTLNFKAANLYRSESGAVQESLTAADGKYVELGWNMDSPLMRRDKIELGAAWRFAISEDSKLRMDYSMSWESGREERQLNAVKNIGFDNFSYNLLKTSDLQHHHLLRMAYARTFADKLTFDLSGRYEHNSIASHDRQWLDSYSVLDEHFSHIYNTAALHASLSYMPIDRLRLYAEFCYAYTNMQGRHLHDFLPVLTAEWRLDKDRYLKLNARRSLIRPGLSYLNPGKVREAFSIRYGNSELVGVHVNNVALDFGWRIGIVSWKISSGYIYANDGFNGIWIEKDNICSYTWGNEGIRHAWNISPALSLAPSSSTDINLSAVISWDKRIAEQVGMSNPHWGYSAHFDLMQRLPAAFALKAFADYSYGATLNLYSHAGTAYRLGMGIQRRFGSHLLACVEYSYDKYADVVITQGAYSGRSIAAPKLHHTCSLSMKYEF